MKRKICALITTMLLAAGILTGAATAGSAATAKTPCTTQKVFGSGQFARYVPVTASGSSDCYLIQGNQGNGVRALQRALLFCERRDIGKAGVDGVFGASTKSAVSAFQGSVNLTRDGEYGNNTRNRIWFVSTATNPTGLYWCNRY